MFFDLVAIGGSTQVIPRKYWSDVEATDMKPPIYFHWMVPQYSNDGDGLLDYDLLLTELDQFVGKHYTGTTDTLTVQASLHDLHFGELEEYETNIKRMANYIKAVPARRSFRFGDAIHMPPGGRSIVERGLRGPRVSRANDLARPAMQAEDVPVFDSHKITFPRPEMSRDGYHYFEYPSEERSERGEEVCIGNAVARTTTHVWLNELCNPQI